MTAAIRIRRGAAPTAGNLSDTLPGDKSISQRLMLLGALSEAPMTICRMNEGHTVTVLAQALSQLGVDIARTRSDWVVAGSLRPDWEETTPPVLWFGGSSAAARMLLGVLAGLGGAAVFDGSPRLRARPMAWVVDPLVKLGARIDYLDAKGHLPVRLHRSVLRPGRVRMEVQSAQAKSALLFAAASAGIRVEVETLGVSRDHTERALAAVGISVGKSGNLLTVHGGGMKPLAKITVPRDASAAAYPAVLHVLSGSTEELQLHDINLNPTRLGLFALLISCGVDVTFEKYGEAAGEPFGSVHVRRSRPLRPFELSNGPSVQAMIDEIPLAMTLATALPGTSRVRNAEELRFKETDRLKTTHEMLTAFGAQSNLSGQGIACTGGKPLRPGCVPGFGDHRIAMSAAVLAGTLPAASQISEGDCFSESFPDFAKAMSIMGVDVQVMHTAGFEHEAS